VEGAVSPETRGGIAYGPFGPPRRASSANRPRSFSLIGPLWPRDHLEGPGDRPGRPGLYEKFSIAYFNEASGKTLRTDLPRAFDPTASAAPTDSSCPIAVYAESGGSHTLQRTEIPTGWAAVDRPLGLERKSPTISAFSKESRTPNETSSTKILSTPRRMSPLLAWQERTSIGRCEGS